MKKTYTSYSGLFFTIMIFILLIFAGSIKENSSENGLKINGFNISGPRKPIDTTAINNLLAIGGNYVSLIPYAFTATNADSVLFDHSWQWWGEKFEGIQFMAEEIHSKGFNIMVKPHLWVRKQGWAGDFEPENYEKWKLSYYQYIIEYASLSEALNVDIFCIGTELRKISQKSEFWNHLIDSVRNVYSGKLVYAANWDNYQNIDFWNKLDYIGIDAYFPISSEKTPSKSSLTRKLDSLNIVLSQFSDQFKKQIIFTEYGFQSVDYSADGHWKYSQDTLGINHLAQKICFETLYSTLFKERWFAGGFVWKYHFNIDDYPMPGLEKSFTPQNKPAIEVIKNYFRKNSN